MRTIIAKELRENLRWLPVGVLLIGAFVWFQTPTRIGVGNISPSGWINAFGVGSGLFAILLGAIQSIFDFSDKQRGFLFHRSLSRQQILLGKIIAGGVLYTAACLVVLVTFGMWLYWNSILYLPVRPLQLISSVAMCAACFLLLPATLICFDRQARWFGTKLFPLIPCVVCLFAFSSNLGLLHRNHSNLELGLLFWTAILILTLGLVFNTILSRLWSLKILLAFASVVVVMAAVPVFEMAKKTFGSNQRKFKEVVFDKDYNLWVCEFRWEIPEETSKAEWVALSGGRISSDTKLNVHGALPEDFMTMRLGRYFLSPSNSPSRLPSFEQTYYSMGAGYYDSRGYVIKYNLGRRLYSNLQPIVGYISKRGLHRVGEPLGPPFTTNPDQFGQLITQSPAREVRLNLWADDNGIYQYNQETKSVATLLEIPIESLALIENPLETPPILLIGSRGKIHLFEVINESGSSIWFDQTAPTRGLSTLENLRFEAIGTLPDLPLRFKTNLSIGLTKDQRLVAVDLAKSTFATLDLNGDRQWIESSFVLDEPQSLNLPDYLASTTLPVGTTILGIPTLFVLNNLFQGKPPLEELDRVGASIPQMIPWVVISVALSVAVAALTFWVAKRRGLERNRSTMWALASLFLGLAAPLSIVAIYRKPVLEPCSNCNHPRRIDQTKCPHCEAAWAIPPREGIELFEEDQFQIAKVPQPA